MKLQKIIRSALILLGINMIFVVLSAVHVNNGLELMPFSTWRENDHTFLLLFLLGVDLIVYSLFMFDVKDR
jgi:hypothetical protein